MDRRNSLPRHRIGSPLEENADSEVTLRSLYPANLKIRGAVTGKEYRFPGAGSEVKVLQEDVDSFLNMKKGHACCGGTAGGPYFELA